MAGEKKQARPSGRQRGNSQDQAHSRNPPSSSSDNTEELILSSQSMTIRQQPASTGNAEQDRSALAARVTSVLDSYDDLELQRLLVRRYWEVAGHPPLNQLRDMAVNILRLAGPRLAPRDAIILLLQAGLNPALAVRQYTRNRAPRVERDVQEAVKPTSPGRQSKEKVQKPQDNDDNLPVPKDVEIVMADDPDTPGAKIPAVYHHHIRKYLIRRDIGRYGKYRYQRTRGEAFEDQTAPHPDQLEWRFDHRDHFPDILLQWKKADRKDPMDSIGDMYWRKHLVVDIDMKSILDFPRIPSTLANNVEGSCLEALERLDGRVRHQDLAARQYAPNPKIQPEPKDFKNRDNALAQRMRRFREKHACISWNSRRSGGEHFPAYIEYHLPAELKTRNTTRGFRDLTDREIAELKNKNLGKFSTRSRTKDPSKRKIYLEHEERRLQKYKEIEAQKDSQVEALEATMEEIEEEPANDEEEQEENEAGEEVTDVMRRPDARNIRPVDKDEEEELHDAMLPTIEHYIRLTGDLPVITDWSRAYLEIHWDIHRQLRRATRVPGNIELPLIGLRRWNGGIRGWWSAELSLHFMEEWAAEMKFL